MEVMTETKVERMILKHLTGSKAGQEEKFDLSRFAELTIGRNPSSIIRYDAEADDLVSGQHAKITQDPSDPAVFWLTDLGSRNGTYVNKQRVANPVRIKSGDLIQFGAGGPEFEFDCEPRPEGAVKTTRLAASRSNAAISASHPVAPTRSAESRGSGSFSSLAGSQSLPELSPSDDNDSAPLSAVARGEARAAVGKGTVERMISEKQGETRRQVLYGIAALCVVLAFAAWKFWPKPAPGEALGKRHAEIAKQFGPATVKIDVTWKLISPSGGLVYHQYKPNKKDDSDEPEIPGGPKFLPCYVQIDEDTYEPYLTYDGNKFSIPIGGSHSGTGFVVSSDGFILTNRHVAATWNTEYDFPDGAEVGIVYAKDKRTKLGKIQGTPKWVPAQTRQEFQNFHGANDKLEVSFPGNSSPVRAELMRTSDRHDVAMIKINMPEAAPKVELYDNYESIQEGEVITVLGYPGVTPPIFGFINSQDVFNRNTQARVIPKVTVTPGYIGAVLRGSEGKDRTVSKFGDVYQLTVNATGSGNSGGPVFDEQGRVIAIFFAGRHAANASVSYAVPIRYGKELMRF